jgi:hypothetical protein
MSTAAPGNRTPRSFGEELFELMCDGRRRARGRTRLLRLIDVQVAALRYATDSDVERVARDARELIALTDFRFALGILDGLREPSQLHRVKQKLADLKNELAVRSNVVAAIAVGSNAEPAR